VTGVLRYFVRRLLFAIALVFVVASGALVLARLAPGDFATGSLGLNARPETVAAARARAGLDRPLPAQYLDWLQGILRLDFGLSLAYDRPVGDLIPERAGNTAILAVTAILLATAIGLPLGVVTGTRRGGWLSALVRATSLVLLSMPPLLTSLFLVFLAARTGWAPPGGMRSPGTDGGLADLLHHMVVPVLALALPLGALLERLQSQAMSDVTGRPFVLSALARGVPRSRLVWRDALKAALGPVASMYGLIAGTALSGSFAVEIVTSWPGLGRLTFDALRARDVYLVAGCAATGAVFLAVSTLVADVALAWVDPRATD
jgi:peptide/nickel transport system permease protein